MGREKGGSAVVSCVYRGALAWSLVASVIMRAFHHDLPHDPCPHPRLIYLVTLLLRGRHTRGAR